MGFVPFAATVGSWLGTGATVGGAAALAGAGAVGTGLNAMIQAPLKEAKKISNAANDVAARDAASAQAVKDSQAVASSQAAAATAQKIRRMRSASQTIYTNPLGLGGVASTARKMLLGQ